MIPDYDVIVVGCGPVGAFAANLFGTSGLKTLIVDRDAAPHAQPRAVHIDHEMARLLADVGLLSALEKSMFEGDGHIHIGADGGVIRYLSAADQPRRFGYANDYFFYQPELEAVLRKGLDRFGDVKMALGVEVIDVSQNDTHAAITLTDGSSVTAAWVVGCDGARSIVRKTAEIALDDLCFDEPWLVVDAEVDGPIAFPDFNGVPEEADLQRLSVMLCDPRRPATLVPGRGRHRRWEFMLLPDDTEHTITDPTVVQDLLAPWVSDVPYRVIRAATYRFHGLVAKNWQRGRIFIAGDAAHQTPPFFGQGLCHGFRDVASLAFKLRLVQSGAADASLLGTYQEERDAQVRHVIGRAIEVGQTICMLDPEEAARRDAHLRQNAGIGTAAELIVPISSRIVGYGSGERFINPRVADGLLDDATGSGWVLITRRYTSVNDDAASILRTLQACHVALAALDDCEGHLAAWFELKGCDAVLVRPDHYTALMCGAEELSSAMIDFGQAMGLLTTDA